MAYSAKISMKKGTTGAIDGVIAGVVVSLVIGFVKQHISNLPAETENSIAMGVGVVVSTAIVAVKRYVENWMKHKDPSVKKAAKA